MANILGAKKATSKLGAKKLGGDVAIDVDEAEKKAKEEAERIEKLGYYPSSAFRVSLRWNDVWALVESLGC
jgi:ADP-ribosylation factor GTPase-activating protein 2/3